MSNTNDTTRGPLRVTMDFNKDNFRGFFESRLIPELGSISALEEGSGYAWYIIRENRAIPLFFIGGTLVQPTPFSSKDLYGYVGTTTYYLGFFSKFELLEHIGKATLNVSMEIQIDSDRYKDERVREETVAEKIMRKFFGR